MKIKTLLIILVLLNLALSGCATINGFIADKADEADGTNDVPDSPWDPRLDRMK